MQADKKQILNRLATIEGHLRGIRTMVEDDVYCVDILKQSYAVERAVKAFEVALLEGHLASCVPTGFKEGRDDEIVRELGALFELSRKWTGDSLMTTRTQASSTAEIIFPVTGMTCASCVRRIEKA